MFLGWWMDLNNDELGKVAQRSFDDYVAVEANAPIIHTMKDKKQPCRRDRITHTRMMVHGIR